jgi:1,4-alpha-glucan branching enzyme
MNERYDKARVSTSTKDVPDFTLLGDDDLYLFNEGSHIRLYEKLGAHPCQVDGVTGAYFAVWAPNAERVTVMGDFNEWSKKGPELRPRAQSGIWEGFVPSVASGSRYKYRISSRYRDYNVEKADPFAFRTEIPPATASILWDLDYQWNDEGWRVQQRSLDPLTAPLAIYEVHLGSWRRILEENNRSLSYRELASALVDYVTRIGFNAVEFMPVMEHPFFGSWGYEVTGYYAPTSRYGVPQDFMYLIDRLHQHEISVILDWVPAHFPDDEHGLVFFDGSHLYEPADTRQAYQPDWNSLVFDFARPEVRSFLISNALFWCDRYHVDGLRVDAVASMLYLDYSRKDGEWIPNQYGGRENLHAIEFLRSLNQEVYKYHPHIITIAEESTAWPMVSRPTYVGGLGFLAKWDMGWMHDTLEYMRRDPLYRRYHHNEITFRMKYAFSENFVLPLSHDEVVYGKASLLAKMPGDDWQKFASLRLLFGYQYAQPGKKLLFMGSEFGQWEEWQHDRSPQWDLLSSAPHEGVQKWVRDLNFAHHSEPALHEMDFDTRGFEWINANDSEQSVLSFIRKGRSAQTVAVVCNFTPVVRRDYRIGVDTGGFWREILNSDSTDYGGSGQGNLGGARTAPVPSHGRPYSLELTLPPLAAIFLKCPAGSD